MTSRGITKGSVSLARNGVATSGGMIGDPGVRLRGSWRIDGRHGEMQEMEVSRLFIAEECGDAGRRDQVRHGVDRLLQDVLDRMELRQGLREPQQRRRGLGGLAFCLEEFGVLEGDRCVGRQDFEEPLILFVELPVARASRA